MKLYNEDCLNVLRKMKSCSIDSIVCDPPYGVNIMNESWDSHLPIHEIWKECFRVLKPGGHILAFSSARLYHHLAIEMENVGFETFNMLAWIYSGGFPKGKNLSLEFDKNDGLPKPDDKFRNYLRSAIKESPYKILELEKICGTSGMFSHYLGKSQPCFPNDKVWKILKKTLKLDNTYDELFLELQKRREEYQKKKEGNSKSRHFDSIMKNFSYHRPKSELAKKWDGYKYGKQAIKPCIEPIYFGQKPPIRPITENVKKWNVGALNIEGCKIQGEDGKVRHLGSVIHDGQELTNQALTKDDKNATKYLSKIPFEESFFYVPKPSKNERGNNFHPTVKPIRLMEHLVRLVTPKGGTCLDPFMGSGTTGVACLNEKVSFIGIERERNFFELASERLGSHSETLAA